MALRFSGMHAPSTCSFAANRIVVHACARRNRCSGLPASLLLTSSSRHDCFLPSSFFAATDWYARLLLQVLCLLLLRLSVRLLRADRHPGGGCRPRRGAGDDIDRISSSSHLPRRRPLDACGQPRSFMDSAMSTCSAADPRQGHGPHHALPKAVLGRRFCRRAVSSCSSPAPLSSPSRPPANKSL